MEPREARPQQHAQVRAPVVVPHHIEEIGRGGLLAIFAEERNQELPEESALLTHGSVGRQIPSQHDRPHAQLPRQGQRLLVELAAAVEIRGVQDIG